jgi:hypothetical protein
MVANVKTVLEVLGRLPQSGFKKRLLAEQGQGILINIGKL